MNANSSCPSPKNYLDKSEQEIISLLDQYLKIRKESRVLNKFPNPKYSPKNGQKAWNE
jgi:hypothetical protein